MCPTPYSPRAIHVESSARFLNRRSHEVRICLICLGECPENGRPQKEHLMSSISRREFFQKTAASAAALSVVAAHVAKLKANPLGLPIGSQTFPFRARIQ